MVKIPAYQITAYLQSPKLNVFLLYGPDQGLIQERCLQLCQQIAPQIDDAFSVTRFQATEFIQEPDKLLLETQSQSLLGGKRVIWIQNATDSLFDTCKKLFTYQQDFYHRILIQAQDLPATSKLRKLIEEQKLAASIPCYHDESQSLGQLIRAHLKKENREASKESLQYLEAHLGEDRLISRQELDKLILYCAGKETIEIDDVLHCIGDHSLMSLDTLIYSLAEGDIITFLSIYGRLIAEGTSEVMMIRTCLRHFQRLLEVKGHINQGSTIDQALSKLKPPLFFKYKIRFARQVSCWSESKIQRVLNLLLSTEASCKQTHIPTQTLCQHNLLAIARTGRQSFKQ